MAVAPQPVATVTPIAAQHVPVATSVATVSAPALVQAAPTVPSGTDQLAVAANGASDADIQAALIA